VNLRNSKGKRPVDLSPNETIKSFFKCAPSAMNSAVFGEEQFTARQSNKLFILPHQSVAASLDPLLFNVQLTWESSSPSSDSESDDPNSSPDAQASPTANTIVATVQRHTTKSNKESKSPRTKPPRQLIIFKATCSPKRAGNYRCVITYDQQTLAACPFSTRVAHDTAEEDSSDNPVLNSSKDNVPTSDLPKSDETEVEAATKDSKTKPKKERTKSGKRKRRKKKDDLTKQELRKQNAKLQRKVNGLQQANFQLQQKQIEAERENLTLRQEIFGLQKSLVMIGGEPAGEHSESKQFLRSQSLRELPNKTEESHGAPETGQTPDVGSPCRSCRTNRRDTLLLPCFHFMFCKACVSQMDACAGCGTTLTGYLKVKE